MRSFQFGTRLGVKYSFLDSLNGSRSVEREPSKFRVAGSSPAETTLKRERSKEVNLKLIPMVVETLYEDQVDCLCVEGKMMSDFGPWKRFSKPTITFDFVNGTAVEYDDEGNVMNQADLQLTVSVAENK